MNNKEFGTNFSINFPKESIEEESPIYISINSGPHVRQRRRSRYSLKELMEQCDFTQPLSEEELLLLRDPPRGLEEI